ncbi:MAG: hypothetical protein Rubg2KO_15050 [Rubricoccaceae bacterium]
MASCNNGIIGAGIQIGRCGNVLGLDASRARRRPLRRLDSVHPVTHLLRRSPHHPAGAVHATRGYHSHGMTAFNQPLCVSIHHHCSPRRDPNRSRKDKEDAH